MPKLSALPLAGPLTGSEPFVLLQEGEVRRAPAAAVVDWIAEEVGNAFELIASTNLLDLATMIVDGKYISTGNLILNDAAWAYVKIPLPDAPTFSWWSNVTRRKGATFLDAAGVPLAGEYDDTNPTANLVITKDKPEDAAFLAFNIKSSTIAIPPRTMVSASDEALPYEDYFAPYRSVTEQAGERIAQEAKADVDATINTAWINMFAHGDFVGGEPAFRSNSPSVTLTQPPLLRRGTARGIRWRAGSDFARYASGGSVQGKYYFAIYTANSVDAGNLVPEPMVQVYKESAALALTEPAKSGEGFIEIDAHTRQVWETGLIDTDVPNILVGSSRTPAVAGTLYATEFTLYLSDAPIDVDEAIRQVNLAAKSRYESMRWAQALAPVEARSKLVLAGAGGTSYVESNRSGHVIRNSFAPFRSLGLTTTPCRFNIVGQSLDGIQIRAGATDDIAPDHVEGTALDMNHGYFLGRATATGHGKTAANEGSIATLSGNDYVLVKAETANQLLLATRLANTAPPLGTYAHGTGNITVTAVSQLQWYPPHNNYSLRCWVDGGEITATEGTFPYTNNVLFVESADLLARSTIVEWWLAHGGASGGLTPAGQAIYRSTIGYRFDCDGQMTVHRDWIFLADTLVTDIMGLQVTRVSNPLTYRIPGAAPFLYDGETLDYGRGVASNRTIASGGNIYFTPARLQATGGEYAHRLISEWADYAFVAGLLPIGDAAYDVRRAHTGSKAMEIRGDTGKGYFRLLDDAAGSFTAHAGQTYSCIGFRHIIPKVAGRPLVTPVRYSDSRAIIYIDWIDFEGLDQVAINCPDLIGRTVTTLDSRNATLIGSGLFNGQITALVAEPDDHATLVLELAA